MAENLKGGGGEISGGGDGPMNRLWESTPVMGGPDGKRCRNTLMKRRCCTVLRRGSGVCSEIRTPWTEAGRLEGGCWNGIFAFA